MHSATTATGKPLPPPGKSPPKNRPAPLTSRPARRPTAQRKFHPPTSTVGAAEISPARKGGEKPARSATPIAVPFPRSFRVAVIAPSSDRARPLPSRPLRHVSAQPSPLNTRAAHRRAACAAQFSSMLHCYIPALIDNERRSPLEINRQPRRLEFTVSRTKQTPAPQINRQLIATSKITHSSISNHHNQNAAPARTRHSSRIARHYRSNRHTSSLENATSRRKQTVDTLSNRHFLQVCASHQLPTAHAHRPTHIVSNRQWQILEIVKNSAKTPFLTVLIGTKTRLLRLRFQQPYLRTPAVSQLTNDDSRFSNHHSRLTASSEFTRSPGKTMLWLGCVCCSCNTFRFDEGAASSHLRPLLLYGWRRSRSKQIA